MGLLYLKTDLKSLKYGNDQRGGGSSNQPYIVTPIPDGYTSNSPDFLLRNGYLNPVNSLQDVSRLTKFFFDTKSPNGLLFTIKQELLEKQNPIQANTDRIYNPFNTITQAGIVSIGGHLNKQGLNPFSPGYYIGGRDGYFFSTLAGSNVDDGINGGENRLALLYTSKVANQPLGTFALNPFGVTDSNNQNNLLSYSGGPNSISGFGTTNIRIQNPTRTVVPKEKATIAFRSSFIDNIDYLSPFSPTINWDYNPNFFSSSDLLAPGAVEQYRAITGRTISESDLFNNNILNRDTSTIIPIGKPANTFAKTQNTDKSKPGYLVPNGIRPGTITWAYRPINKNRLNLEQQIQLKTGITPDNIFLTEENLNILSNKILNKTGLEGENAPDSIYPSNSVISKDSYYKTKEVHLDMIFFLMVHFMLHIE
jgi:hypothetical protein